MGLKNKGRRNRWDAGQMWERRRDDLRGRAGGFWLKNTVPSGGAREPSLMGKNIKKKGKRMWGSGTLGGSKGEARQMGIVFGSLAKAKTGGGT